jgi:hypothetical protein
MNKSSATMALIMAAAVTASATRAALAVTRDEDMARCAAIGTRDARLDCFDALARQVTNQAASAPSGAASMPAAPKAAAAAPTSAAVVTVPPAAAAPAPSPEAAAAADPKNFGLTAAQQHITDLGPKMIKATISILSSDQSGATLVVLDNGQTWAVADNDGWVASGQAVRIRKATVGSFIMLLPSNHSYHVRRVK